MKFSLEFDVESGAAHYEASLAYAPGGDTLIFIDERVGHHYEAQPIKWSVLGAGHRESKLLEARENTLDKVQRTSARSVLYNLERCTWYHFHDTSPESKVRSKGWIEDHAYLRSDGSNLAPYLFVLRKTDSRAYERIRTAIQHIAPDFDDFQLTPTALSAGHVLLNWTEKGLDYLFGPHQMSDGMLRAVALITALQPAPENRKLFVALDEPELGLHPLAITLVTGLLRSASAHTQFLVSTQSVPFVNQWDPEDLVVVERLDHASAFRRLDAADLQEWLVDYSLGELWEKNVLGGRPARS